MDNATAPDTSLAWRAQRGDARAYAELLRRYHDQALGTAFVMLSERQDAEDAAQEAFTKAFLALGNFRTDGSFQYLENTCKSNGSRGRARSRSRCLASSGIPNIAAAPECDAVVRKGKAPSGVWTVILKSFPSAAVCPDNDLYALSLKRQRKRVSPSLLWIN